MAKIIRILAPLIFLALLGFTPRPHDLDRALMQAYQAADREDHSLAAGYFARAASFTPWRVELWEQAGLEALAGGDPSFAIELFGKAAERETLSPDAQLALGEAYFQSGELPSAVKIWETALSSGTLRNEIQSSLVVAYHRLGNHAKEIEYRRALLEMNPGDAQLAYELGLELAAYSPESSMAYLRLAMDLDPALENAALSISRAIDSARLSDDPAFTFLASGRALAAIDEWTLAAEAFDRAVKADPDYAEAWAYLGEARQHLDLDGLPELEKAVSLDSASVSGNTFLALYWGRQGRHDLSLVYLGVALVAAPRDPVLHAELGKAHALNGDLVSSISDYRRAIELAPRDPHFWRMLAEFTVKYDVEVRETGLPAARRAVNLDQGDPASLDVMAQVLLVQGDVEIARNFLQRAIQADPDFAPAHLHLGLVYLESGETYLAYQQLTQAQSLTDPGSPTGDHARRLLEQLFP